MNQPDLFSPLEFADLIAPQSIWDRTLFDHLASRFDYVLQLTEATAGMWSVSIWHGVDKKPPGKLGIQGQLGSLGWTHEPVPFGAAVLMAEEAAATLKQRGVKHVAVFQPGAGWLARVRAVRASTALLSGGAA